MDRHVNVVNDDLHDQPHLPPRLFERLRQISGYHWDESYPPFHSTYDCWHVSGTRSVSQASQGTGFPSTSSPESLAKFQSGRPSPAERTDPPIFHDAVNSTSNSDQPAALGTPPFATPPASSSVEVQHIFEPIIARVSYHIVREERAYHITQSLSATVDPVGDHIVKPLDLLRLPPIPGDSGVLIVAIYSHPGPNYLLEVLNLGPAFYRTRKQGDTFIPNPNDDVKLAPPISLQHFLDFAIGAAQCLEILHHGQGIIHGEIRGDAFHFNIEENKVRVVAFGSGIRSFEHGLTSSGWSTLSKELGAKNKLLYISPEQTGRMPAEPDSRTDIYSLGVLFWTLLTQQPVFEGDTPLDIVQGVLGRRIPNVSTIRIDIPDVIGRIIQKCTAKNIADRYHSASGLRYDLAQVQKFLGDGDWLALKEWRIGTKDVSSFFMLPTIMIGRQRERNELVKVIERVAKSHSISLRGATNRFSDGSSLSNDVAAMDDMSSEGASSAEGTNRRSGSFTHSETKPSRNSLHPSVLSDTQTISNDTIASSQSGGFPRATRLWERQHSVSLETRSLVESLGTEGTRQSMVESSASSLSRQLGSAKFRRRGHCEVVTVEGAGGLGKSLLVQTVLAEARRRGYCATAKFDTARRIAFGPLLKLLSSLFKQVWGERNTETPFHQGLKHYIRPVWPMLHRVLGLPEFLLGPPEVSIGRPLSATQHIIPRGNGRGIPKRRGSSPGSSPAPLVRNPSITSQTSQDFLRAGASTKTMRLMNTFLDVLRVFTSHKFICFCLDDLHFADDESLELISQIIGARMKMVIIVTYRPDELSPEKLQSVIHPPDPDGMEPQLATAGKQTDGPADFVRSNRPLVTRISLPALSEDDIIQYVATTLCRPSDEVLPLALVIQSKTAGNPFYIREMLSACHRNKCIWYDYKDSQWHFDLDKLFEQFQGGKDYDTLDTGFITRRLSELPPAARAILAWAALLGASFSFELICRLMSSEFDYDDGDGMACHPVFPKRQFTEGEAIAGLHAAIQAYIIVPSETDDRFRFAHDRYIHASAELQECNARKMHFVIAQTLMKYYAADSKLRDSTASHICEAADIIKRRVPSRRHYRKLLIDCAQSATENSARPTAAKYYSTALRLLQDDPWADGAEDVTYEETMQLYLRSAECYSFMGHHAVANEYLSMIFVNARLPSDKAPAYVLQSRIYAQTGDSSKALISLKECLGALDVMLDPDPTYHKCDEKFEKLSVQIQTMERTAITQPSASADPTVESIGAVLSETISAAWWSDCLRFYHLTLVMVEMHILQGAFPQSGMAFLHLASVALSRFSMTKFAVDLGTIAIDLLYQSRDPISMARGLTLYASFIGHVHNPVSTSVSQMEDAIEYASFSGDRTSTILSYGLSAAVKFFANENCTDLEGFCQYGCEEIPNWYLDTRGGALLLAIRQSCRALQGKTLCNNPLEVLSDDQHNSTSYKTWLAGRVHQSNRSVLLYQSYELLVLFLYGHYDQAVEVGKKCIDQVNLLWSVRNNRQIYFFTGLALTGRLLRKMQDPRLTPQDYSTELQEVVHDLQSTIKKIDAWTVVSNASYSAWSKILEAQVAELSDRHGDAIRLYEEALDHSAEHNFTHEEALGNYLMAGFFIRRQTRRSARAALLEAIGLYRQVAATGVARAIEEEHSLLLHGPTRNHRTAEAAVQTDFVTDGGSIQYRPGGTEEADGLVQNPTNSMNELKGQRLGAWRGSMNMQSEAGAGLPALDMIDLHAILVSSQVISSVLQVDELFKTMCDVILQTCGGSATMAAIVVQEETDGDQWCVAASGDPEKGASAHKPEIPLAGTSLIAENVVLYCTRFLEPVFIPDLMLDERFGNVSDSWLHKNPLGKAIIAFPISHGSKSLLGVLYLEGEPGSFTDRNVTVLQLLVNQIGISYSNALAMKNVEKISAENRSMVLVQKRALAKALEAETKAKNAEAEAKRNVKLAEEAAKAKSIFLANVSHELRTPLNGVIGNSELLRDSNLSRDQLDMADSIRVSADLLTTVINDILDFSKMEADKMKLYISAFNPEEMVREVVRASSYRNRENTSKKNVKIIQAINLPPMLIYGDPIRLHQVLGNLIGNSLKFTEDGSVTIGARLDAETTESATLTFWVRDTGIGIPPQQLANLFQPFSQADASTARKYGGSGLGLSICKSLIEVMMKGKIRLESEENVGTTAWFTVTFEKAKSDVAAGDAHAKSSPIDRYAMANPTMVQELSPNPYLDLSSIPKEEIRICVAEDNAINQKIAMQYVQRLGYPNVSAYDNGLKAVEGLRHNALQGKPYHIVLMDVQMPVLDGYEATKMIRKDSIEIVRKVLIIAMTASAIQGDREKCLAAGMNDYLAKPVRTEILKKKLDTYIATKVGPAAVPTPLALPESQMNGFSDGMPPPAKQIPPDSALVPKGSSAAVEAMHEAAVLNRPLDMSMAKTAMESPIFKKGQASQESLSLPNREQGVNSRTSTVSIGSSRTSSDARSEADSMSPLQPKRIRRKLTKMRGDSDSSVPEATAVERTSSEKPEKPKGVLTKRSLQRASFAGGVIDDRQRRENAAMGIKEDGTPATPSSAAFQSSASLRDHIFPS
ncbi:putative histidine kinase HHK1p [Stachybotrys elegans]|uniref:histidine kinase n=1 Tax=Stachybotrys elegans TaxID=80388 RepID=A0A8K0SUF2_9HYPO|nr:putative histidine kinase HHK1p [Stachybotrys elegans]